MTYRLHDSLGYHLSLAARDQERRFDEGLKTLGLTRTTWCILLATANEGLTQPSDIADFVGIDRTATSRALRTMEADGLIRRRTGNDDKRTTEVRLTKKGERRLEAATPYAVANNMVMSDRLDPGEEAELRRLLGKLTEGQAALPKL